jgi:hypothetical protein
LNKNIKNICDFPYAPNTEKCFRRKIFSRKMSSLKPFYDKNHFTSKQTEHYNHFHSPHSRQNLTLPPCQIMPKTRIIKLKIPFTTKRKYINSNIQNNNKSRRYKKKVTINSNSTPMNKTQSVRISRKPNTTHRILIIFSYQQ